MPLYITDSRYRNVLNVLATKWQQVLRGQGVHLQLPMSIPVEYVYIPFYFIVGDATVCCTLFQVYWVNTYIPYRQCHACVNKVHVQYNICMVCKYVSTVYTYIKDGDVTNSSV